MYSLVFFLCTVFAACKRKQDEITLLFKDQFAVGINIPKTLVAVTQLNEIKVKQEKSANADGILGSFSDQGNTILFEPLIPLTNGLTYEVWLNNKWLGKVSVGATKSEKSPKLLSIYPLTDTVPENLLKFYLHFDKPMRTGQALNYVSLLDKNMDTLRNVLLDLQPELWDSTGTTLTLWLDPGRIKRDLVLNRKYGNPLHNAATYKLVVAENWKDSHGIKLSQNYIKNFVAGARDDEFPKIENWQLKIPNSETSKPLLINAKEPLDHYLFEESVTVLDGNGIAVAGKVILVDQDKQLEFHPLGNWKTGKYLLKVNAKLEDLGANNLNRVFDRDITKDAQFNKLFYTRSFQIK